VRALQEALAGLGYWLPAADGVFGDGTPHAVVAAFQKVAGIDRDGVVGPVTAAAMSAAERPIPRYEGARRHVEVDLARQVVLVVEDGIVVDVLDSFTGSGREYSENGHTGIAVTPVAGSAS